MTTAPGIVINGQKILWSFIQFVRVKKLGGDWPQTINAFWQARNSTDVIKYVQAGFIPDEKGNKYSLMPSKEWNAGNFKMIQEWWDRLYKPAPKKTGVGTMKDAMKKMFEELSK
jgi:hypothetical protein